MELLSILLQATGTNLNVLGAALGVSIAVLAAGWGIGKIGTAAMEELRVNRKQPVIFG
jgi:F-type H+-transporting ATPase subunit c